MISKVVQHHRASRIFFPGLLLLWTVFLHPETGSPRLSPDADFSPRLLLIIDFSDFSCFSCMESVLLLFRTLPPPSLRRCIFCVLTRDFPKTISGKERVAAIMEKKIAGFKKANRVDVPIYIDRDMTFKKMAYRGSVLFLFIGNTGRIREFLLPLSRKTVEEIAPLFSFPEYSPTRLLPFF